MTRQIEAKLAEIEREQFGLVSIAQLRDLGCSTGAQRYLLDCERIEGFRRGVFACPSVASTFEQRVLGAVLACGHDACGSHESAAQVCSLLLPAGAMIEVTTTLERHPILDGVRVHRSSTLAASDVTVVRGIRVTTPARTIVDLSSRLDLRALGRMVDDALRSDLLTMAELRETVDRLRPAPGRSMRKMRLLLARRDDGTALRESTLEDFIHHAVTRFDLPEPIPQYEVVIDGRKRRIDFCYPAPMVALEPKGFDYRRFRQRFDDDALRGNQLTLAGYKVLEFTSAFTDWQIATHVARALELPPPKRPRNVLTFLEWCARRDRLESCAGS